MTEPPALVRSASPAGGPPVRAEAPNRRTTTDPDVRLLAALADPIRLRIVRQLADSGSVCVCDLDACRSVSQPTVSHHLRILRDAGVVRTERRGTWIYYSLDPTVHDRLAAIVRSIQPPPPVDAAPPPKTAPNGRGRRLPVAASVTPDAGR